MHPTCFWMVMWEYNCTTVTVTFNTVRCPCNGLVREVSPYTPHWHYITLHYNAEWSEWCMFYRTRSCPAYSDISAVPRHWLQWVHSLRAAAPPCQDLSPFHRNMASSEWLTCLSDKCCSDLPFIVKRFHSASTKCISSLKQLHNDRVSAACGNTGNLLECAISLGNTGNLLVFNWCSCKFFWLINDNRCLLLVMVTFTA